MGSTHPFSLHIHSLQQQNNWTFSPQCQRNCCKEIMQHNGDCILAQCYAKVQCITLVCTCQWDLSLQGQCTGHWQNTTTKARSWRIKIYDRRQSMGKDFADLMYNSILSRTRYQDQWPTYNSCWLKYHTMWKIYTPLSGMTHQWLKAAATPYKVRD